MSARAWLGLNLQGDGLVFAEAAAVIPRIAERVVERRWYAAYVLSQHEKAVVKNLELRGVESLLPVYETVRVWKNRQRMKIVLPLFPNYVFVRIARSERVHVLQTSGVLQLVGNGSEPTAMAESEIELLRVGLRGRTLEPYQELVIGERVRIRDGVMRGVEGVLLKKNKSLRFVLTLQLINQHAAVEVDAQDLEPVGH